MAISIKLAHGMPDPDMGTCLFLTAEGGLVVGEIHYEGERAILTSCSMNKETGEPEKFVREIMAGSIQGWAPAFGHY